jgi:LacI family transcriptional regulator
MTSKKKYTIHDIARELNTTASTVSRALKDNPRISEKMRKAVKEMASKLDFQPDFRGQSLKAGKGRTIGVLVPQVDRHFFSTVLRGIDEVASGADYNVLICQSYESREKEISVTGGLLSGKVDGLIASIATETDSASHFEMFGRRGIPLVFFDRVIESMNVSKVLTDDYRGSVLSVEHLIEEGCKIIAHFAGPQHINVYRDRTSGYLDTLKKNGLTIDEKLIFNNTITKEKGYSAMEKILKISPRPDAVFSSGDFSALGAMIHAMESGVNVPEDIAVTGFANEPFDTLISPSLTSVEQHAIQMGRDAASLLIEEIEFSTGEFAPRTIIVKPELIIRNSSIKRKLTEIP